MRHIQASALAALSCAAAVTTHAATVSPTPIATLTAFYDFALENTYFTVANTTSAAEVVRFTTSQGPTTTAGPITVLANSSATYGFNNFNGGFLPNPEAVGTPDTTLYSFSVTQGATTLTSAQFSVLSNATGAYVDFLGNTCAGFSSGCTVAQSGVVASVFAAAATTVPEPISLALLSPALLGLAALRRRA